MRPLVHAHTMKAVKAFATLPQGTHTWGFPHVGGGAATNGSNRISRRATRCLSCSIDPGGEAFRESSGLERVFAAMEGHLASAGVQHKACYALWHLAGKAANKTRLCRCSAPLREGTQRCQYSTKRRWCSVTFDLILRVIPLNLC